MIKDEWEQEPNVHKGRNMVPVRMERKTIPTPVMTRNSVPKATNSPQ